MFSAMWKSYSESHSSTHVCSSGNNVHLLDMHEIQCVTYGWIDSDICWQSEVALTCGLCSTLFGSADETASLIVSWIADARLYESLLRAQPQAAVTPGPFVSWRAEKIFKPPQHQLKQSFILFVDLMLFTKWQWLFSAHPGIAGYPSCSNYPNSELCCTICIRASARPTGFVSDEWIESRIAGLSQIVLHWGIPARAKELVNSVRALAPRQRHCSALMWPALLQRPALEGKWSGNLPIDS